MIELIILEFCLILYITCYFITLVVEFKSLEREVRFENWKRVTLLGLIPPFLPVGALITMLSIIMVVTNL